MQTVAFTLVLNGMPFIKEQAKIIPEVFDKWYVVEGAAQPNNKIDYNAAGHKTISSNFHCNGLSIDGTKEFLDELILEYPNKIEVIRPERLFWDGKTEMCNSFMGKVQNSILVQIDVDEFWERDILHSMLDYSITYAAEFDGMCFKCRYFVGPNLILEGKNCYGDMYYEWNRLWVIRESTKFLMHEPPIIYRNMQRFKNKTLTEKNGWVFNHYAYVNENQLKFKEEYYNYAGALDQWNKLQKVEKMPVKLSDYFTWVNSNDKAIVRYV